MSKITWTVIVGKRGNESACITLPKKLMNALNINIGDTVECSQFGEDAMVIKKKVEVKP